MKTFFNITLLITAVVLTACATPQSQELVQAQQEYSQAQNNPTITNNAPVALREAEQALEKAKNAEELNAQKHYAYIAQKRIEMARSIAEQAETKQQVAQLEEQQEQFLLQLRQQRAVQAQQQAQQAQEELRAYRTQQRQQELESTKQQLQQLQEELASKTRRTEQGVVLTLTDVVFAFDSANLKSGAERGLSRLSDFLKSHPDRKVLVEGFTDSIGSSAYNQQLSQRRAEAVAQALQQDGISPDRITTRGLGEQYPIAPNDTTAGRQQNRRVEITILNPDSSPSDAGRGGQT